MSRAFKWVSAVVATVAVVLLAAVAGLWWWAGTEASLDWALRKAAARQRLVVEGARGTLRTGVTASRVGWAQDGLQVEVRELQLAWQPLSLLRGLLKLDHLRAASVRVVDRRPPRDEPPASPRSLILPARVAVDELSVKRLEWDGASDLSASDLAARYVYDGAQHQLSLRSLRMLDGQYRGEVLLGTGEGFPLKASVQGRIEAPVPGAAAVPLLFEASANGPLADLQARVQLQGQEGTATAGTRVTATARLTPWAAVPLAEGQAELRALDVGALWSQAPRTLLTGRVAVQPAGTASWSLSADLRNSLAGPWDRGRLPAERVRLEGEWRTSGQALVRSLVADVGGGRVQAQGRWQGAQAWAVDATLEGIDPAALHSAMAPLPVGGKAVARADGRAIAFEADLLAGGTRRKARATGLAAAVGALELRSAHAKGRWAGQQLDLPELSVRTSDAALDAVLEVSLGKAILGRGRLELKVPGLNVRAAGSLGETTGGGILRASATDLAQAQRWLLILPGVPDALESAAVAGRAELQASWQGGWRDPSLQGSLSIPQLAVRTPERGEPIATLSETTARFDGPLADMRLDVRAKGAAGTRQGALELVARGGQKAPGAWQGQLETTDLRLTDPALGPGAWRLTLRKRVDVQWAQGRLTVGPGEAALAPPARESPASPALLAWDPIRWSGGELRTSGRLVGLPMAWVALLGGPQLAGGAVSGNLVFDGQWDASLGQSLRLRASLVRTAGDLTVLAEAADGAATRVPAGVREARLTLEGDGEAVTLALRWDSERAGSAQARLATRLSRSSGGGWQWPATAPLSGGVQAQLPRLGVWSVLAPPGWRLRGSVVADVGVSGTRADPALQGTVSADSLALRSVVDGIELKDGRLRARLQGQRVVLEEFVLRGAGAGGGTLNARGEAVWAGTALQARVAANLQNLRVSAREDRLLAVSGAVTAAAGASGAEVRGDLRVEQALIVLPEETAPKLGSDIVVRNAPAGFPVRGGLAPGAKDRKNAAPLDLEVSLNLGDSFRVRGRGIDTRLAGRLTVAAESLAQPRLNGAIRTVGGEYRAYNQRLEIERGVLRFTGPIDNPALDVIAIRPRMEQRVGVQVTGRAQAPFVRLYAEPDLPEAQKLSWLVLGRASAAGGAEAALLQQAALALVASRTGGSTGKGPAALLGLDELGFRRDGADGPAVTLGKRLGQNLYASYERSLSGALGTLYLFYDISRRLTVRAQAGERAAVDLILTFRYD